MVLLILLFAFVPMRLWITALASGSHVGIGTPVSYTHLEKTVDEKILLKKFESAMETGIKRSLEIDGANTDQMCIRDSLRTVQR